MKATKAMSTLEKTFKQLALTFAMDIVQAFQVATVADVADVVDMRFLSRMGRTRGKLTRRQELLLLGEDISAPSNGVRTSDAAAELMNRDNSRLRLLVFRVIERHRGMTCQEVEHLTEIAHETISARIWELHTRGWLRDSGKTRVTRAGHHAIVWVVANPYAKRKSKTLKSKKKLEVKR